MCGKSTLLLFLLIKLFCSEWSYSKADKVTPFNLCLFFWGKESIKYLQNLANLQIKTVHLNLHWKWMRIDIKKISLHDFIYTNTDLKIFLLFFSPKIIIMCFSLLFEHTSQHGSVRHVIFVHDDSHLKQWHSLLKMWGFQCCGSYTENWGQSLSQAAFTDKNQPQHPPVEWQNRFVCVGCLCMYVCQYICIVCQ